MYTKTLISDLDSSSPRLTIGAYYYDFEETSEFLSDEYLENSMFALITDNLGIINGARFFENELLINIEQNIRVFIDNQGDLNITDIDAKDRFEINELGELILNILE